VINGSSFGATSVYNKVEQRVLHNNHKFLFRDQGRMSNLFRNFNTCVGVRL
jgi:hypothetical protein